MIAVNHARKLALRQGSDLSCRELTAANEKECYGIGQADISAWLAVPRIFEIGRKSAFDFSQDPLVAIAAPMGAPLKSAGVTPTRPPTAPAFDLYGSWHERVLADIKPDTGGRPLCMPGQLETCSYVHPLPSRMYPDPASMSIQIAFLLLVGSLLLLGLATGRLSEFGTWLVQGRLSGLSNGVRIGVLVFLGVIAAALLCYLALHIAQLWQHLAEFLTERGDGEPITLMQGVSIWPTELIRATGLALSVWFIIRGWRALDRNLDEIATLLKWQAERAI